MPRSPPRSNTGSMSSSSGSAAPRPSPRSFLAQARLDARDGVPLDTVLRRYFAGILALRRLPRQGGGAGAGSQLGAPPPCSPPRRCSAIACSATVSAEYTREAMNRPKGTVARRRECAQALLAGELVDEADLGYELEGHHLALVATGEEAPAAIRALAERLGRRLLVVTREEEPVSRLLARRRRSAARRGGGAGAGGARPGAGRGGDRRARRGARRLAPQPPPGQGRAADRGAPRAARCCAMPRSSCLPRSPATTSPSPRCASSTCVHWRPPATAARSRGRPCAPTSPPSATSPRPPPSSASIVAP